MCVMSQKLHSLLKIWNCSCSSMQNTWTLKDVEQPFPASPWRSTPSRTEGFGVKIWKYSFSRTQNTLSIERCIAAISKTAFPASPLAFHSLKNWWIWCTGMFWITVMVPLLTSHNNCPPFKTPNFVIQLISPSVL